MSGFRTFVIGRASSRSDADLLVPSQEDTVGRRHAELTLAEDGSIYLVDLKSLNGTFVAVKNQWKRINQAAVERQQRVRLGEYETTVAELLQLPHRQNPPTLREVHSPPLPSPVPRPGGQQPSAPVPKKKSGHRPRRNPSTGEIE
jgi:predicted component of type VI protein secretion system